MKRKIISLFCIVFVLFPTLFGCDFLEGEETTTPDEGSTIPAEITTPKPVEETTTPEEEDLSNVPVRDVSDYPNDSFYLSEEEKAYLESQGVDPDQFLCKVFGGWSWLDFEELMTTGEPTTLPNRMEFDLKQALEWQNMESTQYISYTFTDWYGSFSEPMIPMYQVTSMVDENEKIFSIRSGSPQYGAKTYVTDKAIQRFITDPDRNLLPEPITHEGLKRVFSVVSATKSLKGLKIEKVYIMRPSGVMEFYDEMALTYDLFIYYVTNYGDYVLIGDLYEADYLLMEAYSFGTALDRWRDYLIKNNLKMDRNYLLYGYYWRHIYRFGIPSDYDLTWEEKEELLISLYKGIYPKGKYS